MHIGKLTAKIPASFDYEYTDVEGNAHKERITLSINRLSFGQAASKNFRDAMMNAETDAGPIANILADLISDWDLFKGEDGSERLDIDAETIASLPPDFVGSLATCVFERMTANPPKAADSLNGSAQAASSETA